MYQFYLDGGQLPVTPADLQLSIGNGNKTVSLINQGEINLLKSPVLTDIAFDMLLPEKQYPFSAASGSVITWLDRLEKLKAGRKRFRFIVAREGGSFDTNLRVSLETYTIKEDAAEHGRDVLVSVKLKQFRPYGTKTITVTDGEAAPPAEQRETDSRTPPASHTVVAGDTLWALCKKYLGDATRYPEVAAKNGIANPNLIYPGQVINF